MDMLLKQKRIFIVEDNIMNRVVFREILTAHGAFIVTHRWGRDTLPTLKEQRHIDIIILDLMLPNGISGFGIFETLRSHSDFDAIPIVAVSAMEPSIAIPKAQELGFSGFIAKPIDEEIFPQQIADILQGTQVWHDGQLLKR